MINITTTSYPVGSHPQTMVSDYELTGAVAQLLKHHCSTMHNVLLIGADCLRLGVAPHRDENSGRQVTYRCEPHQIQLLLRVVQESARTRGLRVSDIIDELYADEPLPSHSELIKLESRLGSYPWRIMALLRALELPLDPDLIVRWCNFARLDDFVAIALTAHELGSTFEEVERELVSA